MQFTKDAWPGLADGSITVTFRRWKRRQVVVGHDYRTPAGMIRVDELDTIDESQITAADASRAGAATVDEVIARLPPPSPGSDLYRIRFHLVGPDPRIELRETIPTDHEMAEIIERLDRLDARSSHGSWTRATLAAIGDHPAVRAPDLAASFGRETKPFKLDVRKLKGLGLTESLRVGYRLSPRGVAVLAALDR